MKLFSGDTERTLEQVADHPAVQVADVHGFATLPEPPPFPPDSIPFLIYGYIRTAQDGFATGPETLPVTTGNIVTAEYTQPDGSALRATIEIQ